MRRAILWCFGLMLVVQPAAVVLHLLNGQVTAAVLLGAGWLAGLVAAAMYAAARPPSNP